MLRQINRLSRTTLFSGIRVAQFGVLSLALGFAIPAAAQMSLRQAVLHATERDGNVLSLRQKVASRSVEIEAERDAYYPSISLSGDSSTTDSNGPGLVLSVSQVLYDWGLIRSKIEAASQVRVKAVSDLKMAVEDISLMVSEYFLDVEVIDLKIQKTRNYVSLARRIAGQAEDRALAGISDNGEVARARLEIARADDQLAQLVANRRMALSQIAFLTGKLVNTLQRPPELGFTQHYSKTAKIRSAVRIAPDYVAARAGADEAKAGVKTAKASRLPTIKLQAQGRTDLNGGNTRTAVGLSTGVDLSSSGLGRRQVQSAELNLRAAQSSMLSTERELTNTATTAVEQIQILRRTESARQSQLVESERVLENYEQQFIAGQRELLDVLTTARDLYDSRIDTIDTYDERKRTEYNAARDLGVLGTLILAASGVQ